MKKVTIHQFDPVIYPRKLWVVFTNDTKILKDNFDSQCEYDEEYMEKNEAFVFPCTHRESWEIGVVVVFPKHRYATIKNIAHESVHIASQIFSDCNMAMGFSDGKDEHFAYLTGWAADCINQVKTGKFK